MSERIANDVLVNERQCLRKTPYPSMTDAYSVAVKAKKDRGVWLRVYQCPNCQWFHLTKTSLRAA